MTMAWLIGLKVSGYKNYILSGGKYGKISYYR